MIIIIVGISFLVISVIFYIKKKCYNNILDTDSVDSVPSLITPEEAFLRINN